MNARRIAIIVLLGAILLTTWGTARAQSTDVQFFPETGHNVSGAFLKFYKSAPDPLLVYGYPITEQITSVDGRVVQYFQRARFELTGSQTIQLTPLGERTYRPTSPMTIDNPNACEYFNNIPVCYAFLDFYKAYGGAAQFGYPISPFESSDGLIVQYFQGARFEWRADRPEGHRVVVSDLGSIYFNLLGEDPAQRRYVDPTDATINPILAIKARAFVLKAVTRQSGQQTLYIIVQSQTAKPIAGASGTATVTFSDGFAQEFAFTTNSRGVAQITFNFSNQTAGELLSIAITATYQSLQTDTQTSFRIWY
jgi:hypothetical protein